MRKMKFFNVLLLSVNILNEIVVEDKTMMTSEEIKRRLWEGANDLRGSMDASKYKDYMLGLMFYKFLSDKTLETVENNVDVEENENIIDAYQRAYNEHGKDLLDLLQGVLGYYVLPQHLYQAWERDISSGDFELQNVMDSLNNFERTIRVSKDSNDFTGLFSSSIIDLTTTALGSDLNKRSKNIRDLISLFSDFNMVDLQEGDILGDAYEYLIAQFASNAGKKAGEFYTPRQVSEVMAQIVARTTDITSIYDPTVGSGSLLLTVKKHLSKDVQKDLHYYGQEYITETYNLTRMNLLLHGVKPENMDIKNGNTLAQDWPEDPERPNEGIQFDAVVMNPPYSDKKWNDREENPLKVSDPRFADFGVLPPDAKGDFAYLMHGLYHLGQNGTMAIVLPHGVLFRGSAEGQIRKRLLEKNYIDAIIGLPSNLFTNTGIPVAILILKKNRQLREPVLVIDASNSFIKVGKQNVLQEKDIAKIVDTYTDRNEVKGYSHLATLDEIQENEYNMNIPRYVEALNTEIPHDVDGHIHGGIPEQNILELKILQKNVKKILDDALLLIRPGYVIVNTPLDELTKNVLADEQIISKSKQVQMKTEDYIKIYWNQLRSLDKVTNITVFKEKMLVEIKALLSEFEDVDIYEGYQIIAEVWKNTLDHDTELISKVGFYEAGRTREPNMVIKGKGDKKHEEQDGWIGAIVPNELIAKQLYQEELKYIEQQKVAIADIETELTELIEAAKIEESEENDALYDVIKKNTDDEPQNTFESKKVKAELKTTKKNTEAYRLLHKVDMLLSKKSKINKDIQNKEHELKEAIYARFEVLTETEIDSLMFEKWFGDTVMKIANVLEIGIKEELMMLEMLQNRYRTTVKDLDTELSVLERDFEKMLEELVVV